MEKINIDYKGVLDYLANNQEVPYSNPEAPGLAKAVKENLLKVKEKGQAAVAEIKNMIVRCKELYDLDNFNKISWLDGSNTKTRKYLWAQMKYKDYEANPMSISLFVEKNNDVTRYRISLEIKNDGTDKKTMATYHSHLDIPKEDGMVYVSGSNKWGNPDIITDNVDDIKKKIDSGEIRKVQLCIYIESSADKTNEQYDDDVMNAVKRIIPYYEYVIGKSTKIADKVIYWPSLEKYNPDITKEEWTQLLNDSEITSMENLRMFKMMLELGGESTCANLAEKYGETASSYNGLGIAFGKRVYKKTGCPLCVDEEHERYYTIPFVGRYVIEKGKRRYSWKFRIELEEALKELDLSYIDITTEEVSNITYDKNMILYGPPGTSKTYSTAIYAVAICDKRDIDSVKEMDYDEVMIRYRELLSAGRVAFTTFHQSYGYEEFIEGIKPIVDNEKQNIGYIIEPGMFKKFCFKARECEVKTKNFSVSDDALIWKVTVRNKVRQDCYDKNRVRIDWSMDSEGAVGFVNDMKAGDIILTTDGSRTYINGIAVVTSENAYAIESDSDTTTRNVRWLAKNISEDIRNINNKKMLHRMTCARVPYMSVSDVIKLAKANNKGLSDVEVCENTKPYVFVIDEINRGNISKIFGELITLIEDTKREGMAEQASAVLPYSGEQFSVPSNVYILGTMNTADRSIALMDTALRRRFQFIEMMPDTDVLRNIGADKVDDLDVALMLEKINERITFLYDREHTIGHAFFTKLSKSPTIEILKSIFEKSVIPLLQEYFYEDYQKIQLVLGDNGKTDTSTKFILDEEVKIKNIFKGDADDVDELPEKKYTINTEAFGNLESYKQII